MPVQTSAAEIGATEMTMPGATGIAFTSQAGHPGGGHPGGHPGNPGGGHPEGMNAMTKGCLAGTGVCFISHQGEVYPCGYLPALAGDLRKQAFAEVWEGSQVFARLRDTDGLKGKCGCCEFRNVCMGCRARAYAVSGDFMDEEPFCVYQPKSTVKQDERPATVQVSAD
jgi:radical SAM protein with 4Fe4S-binding SPASM domain